MSRRIKRRAELPDWFDLHKYDGVRSLDIAGWYEQLSIRRDLLQLLQPPDNFLVIDPCLIQLREKPVVDIDRDYPFSETFHRLAYQDAKSRSPKHAYGISVLSVRALLAIEESMNDERRTYARGWWEQIRCFDLEKPRESTYEHQSWLDESVSSSSEGSALRDNEAIVIDLNLPDALLKKGFGSFLKQIREQRDRKSSLQRYRPPDTTRLIEYGVLPFIDLRMWAIQTETEIPNRVLADAIFKEGEGGEEVVRKTTQKLAEKCLQDLDIFWAEAAHEETPTD